MKSPNSIAPLYMGIAIALLFVGTMSFASNFLKIEGSKSNQTPVTELIKELNAD